MQLMKIKSVWGWFWAGVVLLAIGGPGRLLLETDVWGAGAFNRLSSYDVVWDSPGEGVDDSMPLGNGDIGLNVWTEPNGDLLFYISKTDSWGDNGRLLKVGRLRVSLSPAPPMTAFQQRLNLKTGAVEVDYGSGESRVKLMVWVDANHPVVCVDCESNEPLEVTARIELWRNEPMLLPSVEVSDVMLDRSRPEGVHGPTVVEPDRVMSGQKGRIGWYHHNTKSVGPELTMGIQGLAGYQMTDPLLDRIFGAMVTSGNAGERVDDRTLRVEPARRQQLSVYVLTSHPSKPEGWQKELEAIIAEVEAIPYEGRWRRHRQWWSDFWDRSWIYVESGGTSLPPALMRPSEHAVRIGLSQHGGERFAGQIGRVTLFKGALTDEEIKALAGDRRQNLTSKKGVLDCQTAVAIGLELEALREVDELEQLSLEAWVRPEKMGRGGGRIVDKTTPGGDDGFLLDTYPGNSLRLITQAGTLSRADLLEAGQWHHVAAVIDRQSGRIAMFHNGQKVAEEIGSVERDGVAVTRGYILQRFVTACAGRGRYPIKFNGSIFTVSHAGAPGDADYRRWGPGYWWQNTRLPYLSMCASGDFEMMKPLFDMYAGDVFEVCRYRTRRYFRHGGAYYPECIYFWGAVFSESYGWTPFDERDDKLQESGWHKWEWVGGLELAWMMLDYFEHTRDVAFLKDKVIPVADEVTQFFNHFYPTGPEGKLVMSPSQALETWWRCTNPMPEVAGLRAVLESLLRLPEGLAKPEQRQRWQTLLAKIPDLPLRSQDGKTMLAPAELFDMKRNIENPELYAVFPFKLVSFAKPTVQLGIEALQHRWDRGNQGWRQDELFMASLGLADEARELLVKRAKNWHKESRFPAFWGPNYDWVPDQDHGGVLMRILQVMLMQTEGDTIYLMPAWPGEWNADFKLHAPRKTTVSGQIRNGELVDLEVVPASRRGDVVLWQIH